MAGVFRGALFVALVAVGVAGQLARWDEVFLGGGIAFLDPDCYSRMTRVALIEAGGGPSLRFHEFENAPFGVEPHTTAPMDFAVLGLSRILGLAGFAAPRDVAGALVSPGLGLLFLVGLAAWGWRMPFGWAALALAAVSPALAHAFSVGRPDHQSLLILTVAGAWIAEIAVWRGSRAATWFAAFAWSAALWVSLFEPGILLATAVLARAFVLGRRALPNDRGGWGALGFFGILCAAWVVADGFRFSLPDAETRTLFARWAPTIGELAPTSLATLFEWAGWLGMVFPAALVAVGVLQRQRPLLAAGSCLFLVLLLTLGAGRWGPFWVVGTALAAPAVMESLRRLVPGWLVAVGFLISFWPVAAAWDRLLFPEGEALARREERKIEVGLLREAADFLREMPEGTVLAPWWLSPALAYWSGKPMVAGSSHQSLPGIADCSRVFLARDAGDVSPLLARRNVRAIVLDDPARVIPNAEAVLAVKAPDAPLAERLMGPRNSIPPGFQPVGINRFFRVYYFEPAASLP